MRSMFFCAALLVSGLALASDDPGRVSAYLIEKGVTNQTPEMIRFVTGDSGTVIVHWAVPGVTQPTAEELAAADVSLSFLRTEDVVVDAGTGKHRPKTDLEKKAEKQAATPLGLKKLFNRYIRICNDVFVIAGDPRVDTHALVTAADLYTLMDSAESKGLDAQLNKATRQLAITVEQLSSTDPSWFSYAFYDPAAGE